MTGSWPRACKWSGLEESLQMYPLEWIFNKERWLTLLAAAMLAGCTSVSLDPTYSPPVIQAPEAGPGTPSTEPVMPGAQTHPVMEDRLEPLPPIDPTDPEGHRVTFTTGMDGVHAMPPAGSGAQGRLDAVYDRSTRVFRWKASWDNLLGSITGAAFHGPARAGEVGPILFSWPGPFGPRYEGRAVITPELEDSLLRGLWYVSVETDAYPRGELRGQLELVR